MNSPGTQLSDLLYSLQTRVRVMEELIQSNKQGTRPDIDFKWRFVVQSHTLAAELKKIKPLVDAMLLEGDGIISSIGVITPEQVLTFKC